LIGIALNILIYSKTKKSPEKF